MNANRVCTTTRVLPVEAWQAIAVRLSPALLLAVMALAMTACGGSAGSTANPTPANTAPMISGLATSLTVNQDTSTGELKFTVADTESGPDRIKLSASSSDQAIVAPENIVLTGAGGDRSIAITPSEDATGAVNVALTATDPQGLTSQSTIVMNVVPVERSVATFTGTTFAMDENDMPVQVQGFTYVQDADDPAAFDPLLQ